MNKKIKVVDLARNSPGSLFAVGDGRNDFYFVSQPSESRERKYFDDVCRRIVGGEKVDVTAYVSGRSALLVPPKEFFEGLEAVVAVQTPSVPAIDLYSLIQPVKEQQFAKHGRIWVYGYEKKMQALAEGKPQQRLEKDPLARQVVMALLSASRYSKWIRIEGNDPLMKTFGATVFPEVGDRDITERLYGLMNEDGLLDVAFSSCGDSGIWCFESEIVYYKEADGEKRIVEKYKFDVNNPLRDVLMSFLSHFKGEAPMYVHPER